MTDFTPLHPKPGRGHYNRGASASQRAREQRTLILSAARTLLCELGPTELTVQAVVSASGIGRNTFYGHFPNLTLLIQQVLDDARQQLWASYENEIHESPTPIAKIETLAHSWVSSVTAHPQQAMLVLRHQRAELAQVMTEQLHALQASGARAGLFPAQVEPERLGALRAALLELGEAALQDPTRQEVIAQIAGELLLRGLR